MENRVATDVVATVAVAVSRAAAGFSKAAAGSSYCHLDFKAGLQENDDRSSLSPTIS